MKKLLFLLVMVFSITFVAKADNPPTDNECTTSTAEEISVPERPDCIPSEWRYEGSYDAYSAGGEHYSWGFYVWSSNTCGEKEYKVSGNDETGEGTRNSCYTAHYNKETHKLSFYMGRSEYYVKY